MEETQNKVVYFKYLDSLRFFAALAVVLAHGYFGYKGWLGKPSFLTNNFFPDKFTLFGKHIDEFLSNGGYGVEVFFLISGFLITYLLLIEQDRHGKIHLVNFYIRRSLRIWPLYFLIIVLTPFIIMLYNGIKVSWSDVATPPNYLYYIFFLGNFDVINTGVWHFPFAHFWSICVEEHFYIVWPLIIYLIPKKYFYHSCLLLILIAIGSRIYFFSFANENAELQIYLNTLCKIDSLIIGAIFAKIHFTKPIQFKSNRLVLFVLVAIFLWSLSLESWKHTETLFSVVFKKYIYLLLVVFIMGLVLFGKSNKMKPHKKGIFSYLGKISYGIYIYHNIFVGFAIQVFLLRYHLNFWIYFLLYIMGTILLSIISWEFFEKPILKFKKRFEIVKTNR